MLKKFRMRGRIKPIFEKDSTRDKHTLRSTYKLVRCYRCGFAGGTLIKHSIGYCHQDPNRCTQNIKNRNLQKTAMRMLIERIRRRKRIDYKIFVWLRRRWRIVWHFFRRLNR